MPETTEAADQPPRLRRRFRYLQLAGIGFCVFVLSMILMYWWKSGLNASERRFLGVWTWQNAPGEMTCHYRDDGTMHFTVAPNNTILYFEKWKVDANLISFESVERNLLTFIVKKVFHKHEQYQVTFNADGSITFKSADGTVKVLIPWASDQGEFLKQSE